MHIPDGYLSPSTCAALYAASAPFWYVALRRLKRLLTTRLIPLLSVFAAFSFLVMMFNLPLPGGTTGHAVGVAIAAIILGPWASILAISIALLIQALFFGDGGITTLGANCFNMAIVGSLVAYLVYRLLAGRAAITLLAASRGGGIGGLRSDQRLRVLCGRRVWHSAAAFQGPERRALVCPLPFEHRHSRHDDWTLDLCRTCRVGLVGRSGGLFPARQSFLAEAHRPGRSPRAEELRQVASQGAWSAMRPLWIALALLLALTPLGVLAGGAAWGEWGARDFSDAAARRRIAAASGNLAPPPRAPEAWSVFAPCGLRPFPSTLLRLSGGRLLATCFPPCLVPASSFWRSSCVSACSQRGSRRPIIHSKIR